MKAIKSYFTGDNRVRYLLGTLIALVIADGFITQYLIINGLAREGNPFLQSIVGESSFLVLKVVGAIICALVLWDIHKRWPKVALVSSTFFVALYTGIIIWNVSVFFIASSV